MAARLWASSRAKKNKAKVNSSTSKVINVMGEDISYLPLAIMVLGSSLHNVPLEIDTRVLLEPMGSSRHRAP